MARGNFEECLKEVLKHEGGYSDHPKDPGGRTMLGVTQRVYEDWIGHKVDERIMRSLTVKHVEKLYKVKYWDAVRGDDLPRGVDLCVFDFAVNAGPNRAARYLQRMVGANEDGVIGPATMSLLNQHVRAKGRDMAVMEYQDRRRDYYRILKTFSTFGKGWMRRVRDVEARAIAMARQP